MPHWTCSSLTKWERKRDGTRGYERFSIYKMAIQDGLDKLRKYYCKFDEKPAYILALSKSINQVSLYSVLNVSLQYCIHTISSIISKWHGEVQKSKRRR